jgi:hypothetical protein
MAKIGEIIARIRNPLKLDTADIRLTDRDIYSLVSKHRNWIVKREDDKKRIMASSYTHQTIPCEELIDVDRVECCDITTNCFIKRTKRKIPEILHGYVEPLIHDVRSIDGIISLTQINSAVEYQRKMNKSTAKYDKEKYYFYQNGYLYFPNLDWDAVMVQAYFNDPLAGCGDESCLPMQEQDFIIPGDLEGEIEKWVREDLKAYIPIQQDVFIDKSETNK